jgi:predicted dienelactone hydrolase
LARIAQGSTPDEADVSRTIAMVFAGDPGAAGGDVNADGRANAADVCGVLLGLRSPTQPGPFGVGIRRITFTKQSETTGTGRALRTDIWYPAPPDAGPITAALGGVQNAPLAEGASNLPLLLFSHGSCGFPEQSLFLTPLIASYGFIVAAPPHPGNTLSEFPTCGSPAQLVDSFANREADIRFVIDSLLALNDDPMSFLYGTIDPTRIGMSGHSFGGQTTLRVCADDARVIAGLALAPALAPVEAQVNRIDIPMMVQDGAIDSVTPFAANALATYNRLKPPRYLLEILNAGHYAFSDNCFPSPDCGPDTLIQDEAHLFVLRYAIPYLLHWLAGDTSFDAFLSPEATPSGVVLSADLTGEP